MTAAHLGQTVEMLRNFPDIEKGHVDIFNGLSTLLQFRQEALNFYTEKLKNATKKEAKEQINGQIKRLETEINLLEQVETRHLYMVNFMNQAAGASAMHHEIKRLKQLNNFLTDQLNELNKLNSKIMEAALRLTNKKQHENNLFDQR